MEQKPFHESNTAQSGVNTGSLDSAVDSMPVSSYSSGSESYELESLEVRDPSQGGQPQQAQQYKPTLRSVPFSRRKAAIVSAIITILVTIFTGTSVLLLYRNNPDESGQTAKNIVPVQDLNPQDAKNAIAPPELSGEAQSLLINGDIISRGTLQVSDGSFVAILRPQALAGNQTYSLPSASGVLCLDSNNCNFATANEIQQLRNELGQIVVPDVPPSITLNGQQGAMSIQGTSNQISVTTAGGTITLATPQDIAPISSPTFSSMLLSGNLTVNGTIRTSLNCTTYLNGGALTTDASGNIICADDETSGAGTSVTTISGGTPGTIPIFTTADQIEDSIISQALGTITVSGDLSANDVSANSLTLTTALAVGSGGTGVTTFTANGVIYGNGAGNLLATAAPATGQVLLGSVGNVPTFTTVSGDVVITGAGVTTIQPNSVELGVDTFGDYMASLGALTGLSTTGNSGEGSTPTLSVVYGSASNTSVEGNTTLTVTASTGLSGGGTITLGAGGTVSLGVLYGSTANTAVEGNTQITLNPGTNLSGGGTLTLGAGGALSVDVVDDPTFATSVTSPQFILTGAGSNGTIQVANLGQPTTYTLPDPGGATGTICILETGSCAPGTITTSGGTPNYLPYFTGANNLEDSIISQPNGTTINIGGSLTLSNALGVAYGGTGVDASAAANGQLLIGNGSGFTLGSLTQGAGIIVTNNAGSITIAATLGTSISNGEIEADAVTLGAQTTGDYIATLGALTGLTTTGNSGEGSTPTLAVTYGSTANTAVEGDTTLTVTAGTNLTGGGTVTLGAGDTITVNVADSPTFAGNVTVEGGNLVLGTAAQAGTITISDGSTNTGTVQTGPLGQDTTFTLPDPGQATADICLSTGNCNNTDAVTATTPGTPGRVAVFDAGQNIADSWLLQNGSTLQLDNTRNLELLGGNLTVAGNGSISGTVTLSGLANGFLEVNGTGVVSVGTIDLGTDTVGNYVATITNGSGISGSSSTEGGTPTIALGNLTADWVQSGAFDVVYDNADAELRMLESVGNTFYGMLDVGDLSADQTYTFLQGGDVVTSGNVSSYATTGVTAGNGLTGGGTTGVLTLDIGAGNGITVNANDIAVVYGSAANTAVEGDTQITVTAGTNLTGGGSITLGTGGTLTVNVADSPIFAGSVTVEGGNILLGTTTQVGSVTISDGSSNTGTVQTGALGQDTTFTLPDPGQASADICLSTGNCAGAGSSVTATTPGTAGRIAVFDAGQNIADSWLLQNGSTLQLDNGNNFELLGGNLTVTGNADISGTVTFSALASGFLEVNGSGLVSVGTIDLGTDTAGNYVATITNGNGITGSSSTEGGTPTIALGPLTADWVQSGAFDIVYDNAGAEMRILESLGDTFYGTFDVGDLSADQTYTFLQGGTVVSSGNVSSFATTGVTAGNGLTGGGTTGLLTLDIGAGNGITVNANDIAVVYGSTANTAVEGDTTLTVTAGTGVSGGGTVTLGTGGTVTLDVDYGSTAGTAVEGNTTIDVTAGTNLSGGGTINLGAGGTVTLNVSDSPTFAGDVTVQGGTVSLGVASTTTGSLDLFNAASTFAGSVQVASLGQATVYTLPDPGQATADICLSTGNCAGAGGGVTTAGGSNNRLAKFNGSQTIADSTITDDGTTVTTTGDVVVQGGSLEVGTALQDGAVTLYGNGFTATLQTVALTGNQTFSLPDGSGEICIKELGNCAGAAGGNAPNTAQFLTLALDAGLTAERTLSFDGTNFSVTDGGANGSYSVNTAQDIDTTAAPSFAGLTLTGNLNLNGNTIQGTTAVIDFTNFDVDASGNTTVGGTLDVDGNTDIAGTLAVTGATTLTGATTVQNTLAVQGASITIGQDAQAGTLSLYDGATGAAAHIASLQVISSLAQNTAYILPDPGQASVEICLSTGNCAGAGGGVTTAGGTTNRIAKFSGTQTLADSSLSDDGSLVTVLGAANLSVQGGTATLGTTTTAGGLVLHDGNGQTTTLRSGNSVADITFYLPIADGSSGQCVKTDGSGQLQFSNCNNGSGSGGALTLQDAYDASGVPATITTTSAAKGILFKSGVGFNSTTAFQVTPTGTTTPTFNVDTVNSRIGIGTATPAAMLSVGAASEFQIDMNGNVTSGTVNGQTISATASFTGTLEVASLATFNGGLTVEAGDTFTVNGDGFTDLTGNGLQVTTGSLNIAVQANKGLEVDVNGLSLIDCGDGEVLKYDTGTGTWGCDVDAGGTGVGDDVLVNGTNADGANFVNTTADGSTAGVSWSLNTVSTPDAISLNVSAADATTAGVVTANSQTFGGAKTFNGQITAGAGIDLGTQTLQGTTAVINFNNFDVEADGDIVTAGDVAVNGGDITSTGVLNITPGGALTVGATNQTLALQGTTASLSSNGAGNDITLTSADQIILNALTTIELQDNTNIAGSLDVSGTFTSGTLDAFQVSAAGAITAATGITSSGTITFSSLTGGFLEVDGSGLVSVGTINLGADTSGDYVATITAGGGLTGDASGAGSTPTLAIGAGNGITVNADDITLSVQANKGLEVDVNGLSLIDCGDGEVLKYDTGTGTWGCDVDAGGTGVGDDVSVNGTDAAGANFIDSAATATAAAVTWSLDTLASPDEISLSLGAATGTEAGIVTANAQAFGGNKTFNGQIIASGGVDLAAQTLQGTTAIINFNNFDVEADGDIITAGDVAVNGGDITSTAALNITPGGALTVGATGQSSALQGTTVTLTSNGAGNDITLTGADQIILNAGSTIELQDTTNIAGDVDASGSLTVGTLDAFQVSTTGAITAATGITSSGTITFSGLTGGFLEVDGSGVVSVGTINLGTDTDGDYVATITAGGGLTGDASGEGSTPTITIGAGNGIIVNADDITLDVQTNKGLEVDLNGLSLIDCADGEVLKYETTGNTWACAADAGGTGVGDDVSVNGTDAAGANFLNSTATATSAAVTWSLNDLADPDEITLAIGAASSTDAGIVTANAQTFGGAKTFNSQITASGGIDLGAQTLQGTTAVINFSNFDVASNGDTVIGGTLTVAGATSLNGAVNLGDSTADSITFNGRVASDVVVATDDTYDLGTSTLRWQDLFLNNELRFGTDGNDAAISYDTTGNSLNLDASGDGNAEVAIADNGDTTISGSLSVQGLTACDKVYVDTASLLNCGTSLEKHVSRLNFYGHSYGYGVGASSFDYRYSTRLAQLLHAQEFNKSWGGAVLAYNDVSGNNGGLYDILQNETRSRTSAPYLPTTSVGVLNYGVNDLGQFGPAGLGPFQEALRAAISRHRAAAVFEETDGSVAFSGTDWSAPANCQSSCSGTNTMQTLVNGATYTISVPADFPGGDIAIGLIAEGNGNGAVHSYTVDGSPAGSIDTRNLGAGGGHFTGVTYRLTGLSAGAHTIVGTVSSLASITFVDYWQIEAPNPPLTVVQLAARMESYAIYGAAPYQPVDADIPTLNAAITSVVNEFDDNVITVDIDSVLNKDPNNFAPDEGHPNDLGHALISAALYKAISQTTVSIDQLVYSTGATAFTGNNQVFQNSLDSTTALRVQNTAGTTIFNVDTTNLRVGIGTEAPNAKLHIASSDGTLGLLVENTTVGAASYSLAGFKADTQEYRLGTGSSGEAIFGVANDFFIFDNTNTAVRLVIDSSGNVGIGDTSPAALFTVGTGDLFQVDNTGAIAAATGISMTGNFTQTGAGTFSTGTGTVDLNGNTTVAGTLNANGNTTLGDATSDTVTFTGRVNSDILPSVDDTYSLGSSTFRWQDLYLGPNSLHIGTDANEGVFSYDTATSALSFSNATTSNRSFAVQNSSAVDLFTVDTVNDQLLVVDVNPHTAASLSVSNDPIVLYDSLSTNPQTAIAYGTDGFARVAYRSGNTIRLIVCEDINCTSKTDTQVIASAGMSSTHTLDIALDSANLPRIARTHNSNSVSVTACSDTECLGSTTTLLTSSGTGNYAYVDIEISPTTSNPGVVWKHSPSSGTHNLYFQPCTNADCTTVGTRQTIGSARNATGALRLFDFEYDSNGIPTIAHSDFSNNLSLTKCADADCTSETATTILGSITGTSYSMELRSNDYALISYQQGNDLRYVECTSTDCSTRNFQTVEAGGANTVGAWNTMALDTVTEAPKIAYYDSTNGDLKLAVCDDTTCAAPIITAIDQTDDVGTWASMAINPDNRFMVSYIDATNSDLKYMVEADQISVTGVNLGSSTSKFGEIFVARVNTEAFNLRPTTDSETIFNIQNAVGTEVFNINTSDSEVSVTGSFDVSGATTIGSTLNVAGAATLQSTLTVLGASMTVGSAAQQGAVITHDGAGNTATIQTVGAFGQDTTFYLPDEDVATATICVSTGNCAGLGGVIGGSGTQGRLAYFDASNNISDSWLFQNSGTTTLEIDAATNFSVASGNLTVDTDVLFVNATSNQVSVGTASPPGSARFTVRGDAANNIVDIVDSAGTTQAYFDASGNLFTSDLVSADRFGSQATDSVSLITNDTARLTVDGTTGDISIANNASVTGTLGVTGAATFSSTVTLSSLPSTADTDAVVCRNSANQLDSCANTVLTDATGFMQGGNDFGTTTPGELGTINAGDLNFITTDIIRMTLEADGDFTVDSNSLFVNAATNRVGINSGITPGAALHVSSDVSTDVGLIVRGASNQTADLLQVQNDLGGNVLSVSAKGAFTQTHQDGPTILGSLTDANLDNTRGVAVSGEYAYVTGSTANTLNVIDISDPANPAIVGSVTDATALDAARSIVVAGNYAYVGAFDSDTFTVVDISDPTTPVVKGSVTNSTYMDTIYGLDVSGRYAYVGGYLSSTLSVVDLANPANPTIVGTVTDGVNLATPYGVKVMGRYAYVTDYNGDRLTVVDVSDPTSPSVVGSVTDTALDGASYLDVDGKYAYVASTDGHRITIVDVSDPTALAIEGSLQDVTNLNGANGVVKAGDYAYVTSFFADSVSIVDVSDPAAPTLVGATIDALQLDGAITLAVSGNRAYVVAPVSDYFTVLDIYGTKVTSLESGTVRTDRLDAREVRTSGNVSIEGSLIVGKGGIDSHGNVSVQGNATFKNQIDSASAYDFQNAAGTSMMKIDTIDSQVLTSNISPLTAASSNAAIVTIADNSVVDTGDYPSVQMGQDGFARIAYRDKTNTDLKYMVCENFDCTQKTSNTVVTGNANDGESLDMELGSDGLARIVHHDGANFALYLTVCQNDACTSSTTTTISPTNTSWSYVDLELDANNLPRIAYEDYAAGDLEYIECTNADCSTRNTATVDAASDVEIWVEMELGSDTYPRFAYVDYTTNALKYARCVNVSCSSGTVLTTVANDGDAYGVFGLELDQDNNALITHNPWISGEIDQAALFRCTDADCTSYDKTILGNDVGYDMTLTLDKQGLPRIVYTDHDNGYTLKYVECKDMACKARTEVQSLTSVDSYEAKLVVGEDNITRIVTYDGDNDDLLFIIPAYDTGFKIGDINNRFDKIYVQTVDANSLRIGTTTDGVYFSGDSPYRLFGNARNTIKVVLRPEYESALFEGDGTNNVGYLDAGFCSNVSGGLTVNTTLCAADEAHSYYSWTTAETTQQDYDIYVRYKVPSDFDTFAASDTIKLIGRDDTTFDDVSYQLFQADGTECGSFTTITGLDDTWNQAALTGDETTCDIKADDIVTFKIRVRATNGGTAYVGELSFTYLSKF